MGRHMSRSRFILENRRWLGAGVLLTFCSGFGQTYFIAIFAGEIRAEFGLTDGQWGAIYTAGTLASVGLMLWLGGLADRFRVRHLGLAVLGGLALACLAMAAVPAAWALPAVIFALRFCGQGMAFHLAMVGVSRWFAARRGQAVAVAGLGVAAGEALLPITFVALMGHLPWRALWLIAALVLLAALPLLWRLLRVERQPQSFAADPEARTGLDGRHWTRREMLRHPLFWMVLPLFLAPPSFATVLFFSPVHLAAVKGWELAEFVALFPVYTAASVSAMLLAGAFVDRLGAARLVPFYQVPLAGGFLLLSGAEGIPGAGLAMAVLGAAVGTHATLVQAFWVETYGTRHLGSIRSASVAAMVLGTALGPGISGLLIDAGITFPEQMGGIAAAILMASGLAYLGLRRVARTGSPARGGGA